ncbi:MAG: Gfo/Idh/MocA family oxidoreductase [Alphaproteobacteria bacterium]|nr:Gfo/Idh/MocA family oxidoreductase [Alphaproteobacteria bacterium]
MGMKVAFIGGGYMGREHIKAYKDIAGVTLAGIYNRTTEKAQQLAQEYGIETVAQSVDDLYANTKADLVVISVYETAMLDIAMAAMKHPWALFLEKPPGYTVAIAQQIADAAAKHSKPVMVGLNRRYLSSTQTVMASLAKLEGPRTMTVFDQQGFAIARQHNHAPEVVANWMYSNSIHLLDYVTLMGRGNITDVQVLDAWNPETSKVLRALIRFDSGDSALYQAIWDGPGPWSIAVATPAMRWEMRPLEKATFQNRGEHKLNETPMHEWDTQYKPGLRLQAERALARVRGEESDIPDMREAMKTMHLIARIYGG